MLRAASVQTPAHTVMLPPEGEPEKFMMFLHGILGSRSNWRGIARRLIEARSDWGAVLVDLREHGESRGFAPPHTIESAANDLLSLEALVPAPIVGVLGHSFGGKVAVRWFSQVMDVEEMWLIDSLPGPRLLLEGPGGVLEVIETLEGLPGSFEDRDEFVSSLERAGHDRGVARWLAMNLARQADGRSAFSLDLRAMRELLTDYARTDLWPVLEEPRAGAQIHAVLGGKSAVYGAEDKSRLQRVAERNPILEVHVIEGAGHSVHVDAPEALLALLAQGNS